jgi:signal transduction histidine kinase
VLLFRMRALPNQRAERAVIGLTLAAVLIAIALIPGYPIVARVRRLGVEARRAAEDEYRSIVDVGGRDEMSSIAFAFNEASSDIRRRATDTRDREESLRRYLATVEESVGVPLRSLEQRLDDLSRRGAPAALSAEINAAVVDAHTLAMRVQNLSVAGALKMSMDTRTPEAIDLGGLVARVVDRQAAFARAAAVEIDASSVESLTASGDEPLLEQAVNNLVDNAIRYNRAGGHVAVSLDRTRDGRFSLRVEDDGPGVPDEVLERLNANRRFRGDEGRAHQPGELGLGLAIVREASDRLGIRWAFRRSARGWFQAELTGNCR